MPVPSEDDSQKSIDAQLADFVKQLACDPLDHGEGTEADETEVARLLQTNKIKGLTRMAKVVKLSVPHRIEDDSDDDDDPELDKSLDPSTVFLDNSTDSATQFIECPPGLQDNYDELAEPDVLKLSCAKLRKLLLAYILNPHLQQFANSTDQLVSGHGLC